MKTHPVVALIAIAVITIEAALILLRAVLVPVVALLLTLAQWRPAASVPRGTAPLRTVTAVERPLHKHPQPHPLSAIAAELELLPVTALRQMAGIRSKRHTKAALIAMVIACS